MKKYRMEGPSGPMETMARNAREAWNHLRFRLVRECGLSWYDAGRYDHRDLKAVD